LPDLSRRKDAIEWRARIYLELPLHRRTAVIPDQRANEEPASLRPAVLRVPLFRLLAINLAVGIVLAAALVGGLLALNPGGLRHQIFADASPGTALGLLLFGFVVTLGSTAMGTAIMAMGRTADDRTRRGPPLRRAAAMVRAKRPR
jgi:hypothetical protein